jgi:hypothetical protein
VKRAKYIEQPWKFKFLTALLTKTPVFLVIRHVVWEIFTGLLEDLFLEFIKVICRTHH